MSFTTIAIIIAKLFISTAPIANCSWFGGPLEDPSKGCFHLGETASGQIFNKYTWTCASPYMPLGTLLWVYCEETRIWLIIKVVDRGPYKVDAKGNAIFPLEPHPTRQLDLSTLTFFFLSGGDLDRGLQHIRYRVIGRDVTGMRYPGSKTWEHERELFDRR